ncbi:L,D-transpeptidase family protein [Microbulbifer agarilyticus]|uniref:L,D-transpeptidase family protein n=1 Tax=Microbulbifer agarilyticus TaxID=260552 RepID=UPI001C962406|nr:L,D-transpeptidase family protein [Microbulbifer agarilyticus]MBY6210167.1 L,D-transpeptidase family protein [Microbulbifer agarilyticus]
MGNKLGYPVTFSAAMLLSLSVDTLALEQPAQTTPNQQNQTEQTAPAARQDPQERSRADDSATSDQSTSYSPYTPYGRQYALMREEFARYQSLSNTGNWQPLPAGQPLAPGVRDERVKALRGLLMQYGDLTLSSDMAAVTAQNTAGATDKTKSTADLYDQQLRKGVERFQRRHGLRADGVVDKRTRDALNTPPKKRLETLEANLARWQQTPKDLGPRYLVVNIPEYTLRLMQNEQEQYQMRVVVGKTKHQTPRLSTRMTRVVFNPTWTVPRSIALKELLPKGAGTLTSRGYRLVNNRGKSVPFSGANLRALRLGGVALRQRGGEGNALGRFKFIIPNQQAIFLHDTQKKELFGRNQRAFSHGCVRLQKPRELAQIVLADQGRPGKWDQERLARFTTGSRTRSVELDQPIPVHIVYWTAWVDEEGLLNFRPDIYQLDKNTAE